MSPPPPSAGAVDWMPWTAEAFARAAAGRRPVLLSLAAGWCPACREMDRTTFGDPAVAATINERFVPIRVLPDAHPDIAERYGLGGWPTTAFLSSDGRLLGGGTFIEAARMPAVLDRVLGAFASVPVHRAAPPAPRAAAPVPSVDDILAAHDPVHGGFGTAPKFPHAPALRLALRGSSPEGRTPPDEAIVVRSLDAMGWGGLYDEVGGGFFHYAAAADWSAPHSAKRLEDQAILIRLYLEAGEALGIARFTERAWDTLAFVQAALAVPDGGWICAAHGPREGDPTLYADANAAMVSAALHAARVAGDDGLAQFAVTSLERVLLACYRPGGGVAHFHDGAARRGEGLLADQVAMAAACLDAYAASGQAPHLMMAEELMHYAVRALWDEAAGAFRDRASTGDAHAIGLLAEPRHPFALNCAAATVLRRLTAESGDHDFAAHADRALASMAPLAASHGVMAAHYLIAAVPHRATPR